MTTSIITPQQEMSSFDDYVLAGGLLSKEEFQESLKTIKQIRYPSHHHPTRLQAQFLLNRLSRVHSLKPTGLKRDLERLYVVLRTKHTPPCSLQSDQKLFLQALLMLRCYEASRLFQAQNILS